MVKRLAERYSDVYKLTAQENSLIQYSKTFIKKSITIGYVVLYMYEENKMAE